MDNAGAIKLGCTKTPAYKSRFCDKHKPRVFMPSGQNKDSNIDPPGPSYAADKDFPVIHFVTDKRTAWAGTYYQVYSTKVYGL